MTVRVMTPGGHWKDIDKSDMIERDHCQNTEKRPAYSSSMAASAAASALFSHTFTEKKN